MKRCVVCGNVGDKDSTVCEICGNKFPDVEDESDLEKPAQNLEETEEKRADKEKNSMAYKESKGIADTNRGNVPTGGIESEDVPGSREDSVQSLEEPVQKKAAVEEEWRPDRIPARGRGENAVGVPEKRKSRNSEEDSGNSVWWHPKKDSEKDSASDEAWLSGKSTVSDRKSPLNENPVSDEAWLSGRAAAADKEQYSDSAAAKNAGESYGKDGAAGGRDASGRDGAADTKRPSDQETANNMDWLFHKNSPQNPENSSEKEFGRPEKWPSGGDSSEQRDWISGRDSLELEKWPSDRGNGSDMDGSFDKNTARNTKKRSIKNPLRGRKKHSEEASEEDIWWHPDTTSAAAVRQAEKLSVGSEKKGLQASEAEMPASESGMISEKTEENAIQPEVYVQDESGNSLNPVGQVRPSEETEKGETIAQAAETLVQSKNAPSEKQQTESENRTENVPQSQGGSRSANNSQIQSVNRAVNASQGQSRSRSANGSQGQSENQTVGASQGQGENRTVSVSQGQGENRTIKVSQGQGENRSANASQSQGGGRTVDASQGQGRSRTEDASQAQGRSRKVNGAQKKRGDSPVNNSIQGQKANHPGKGVQGRNENYPGNSAQNRNGNYSVNSAQGRNENYPGNNAQGRNGSYPVNGPQGQSGGAPARHPSTGMQPSGVPAYGIQSGGSQTGIASRMKEAAREVIGSPLFVAIAVLYTIYLASGIAAIFMGELSYSQILRLLSGLDIPSQISGYLNTVQDFLTRLDSGAIAVNLIIRIPDMLFCLGLWLVVMTVRSAKEKMSGVGFFFLRLVVVVDMIVACLLLLLTLIVSVTLVIAAWGAGTQSMMTVAAATLIISVIVTMAVIMYYFCYLSTLKTCRVNANTGDMYGKVSIYVALVHMVFSLLGIISILSGIVNMEITGITMGVGEIGWMFLFGVWILIYRFRMRKFRE